MWEYNYLVPNDELYHHGIKDMHWGIRRWQNEDGSLTSAGRIRYGVGKARDATAKSVKMVGRVGKKAAIGTYNGLKKARAKRVEDEKRKISGHKNIHELTDEELDKRIARLKKEEDYISHLEKTGRIKQRGKGVVTSAFNKAVQTTADSMAKQIVGNMVNSLFDTPIVDVKKSNSKQKEDQKKKDQQLANAIAEAVARELKDKDKDKKK